MREILFRGKRIDNGEWVEGDLVHSYFKVGDTCINASRENLGFYEVDPSTAGQYTGLCDKNGKKIFEGDILSDVYGMHPTYAIIFNDFCAAFQFEYTDGYCEGFLESINHKHMEVIGTIHDNPELLEVSHE